MVVAFLASFLCCFFLYVISRQETGGFYDGAGIPLFKKRDGQIQLLIVYPFELFAAKTELLHILFLYLDEF